MAWRFPVAPIGTGRTTMDEWREVQGLVSPAGSFDDVDEALERRDLERDKRPVGELFAYAALYGERTRSGLVTPLGANRPPIDDIEEAAMSADRAPVTPEDWEPCYGPVASVPVVTLEGPRAEGCVTVGNRVMAFWQDFGHMLGNGTIVGFERHAATGWIKVVIDYDYPTDVSMGEDGFVRWDYDRTCLCYPAHWDGETQEQSVGRWRDQLANRFVAAREEEAA